MTPVSDEYYFRFETKYGIDSLVIYRKENTRRKHKFVKVYERFTTAFDGLDVYPEGWAKRTLNEYLSAKAEREALHAAMSDYKDVYTKIER